MTVNDSALTSLDVFVGEWKMGASLVPSTADAPHACTMFEWLPGKRFLIQRWEVDYPDAPDGIAIIGFDADAVSLLQHYFDSRGVQTCVAMTFADRVWTLERLPPVLRTSRSASSGPSSTMTTRSMAVGNSSDGSNWNPDLSLTYTHVG